MDRQVVLPGIPFADLRVVPNYPTKSPLDDIFRLVDPGTDEFQTEKYAFEIASQLETWKPGLVNLSRASDTLSPLLHRGIEATSWHVGDTQRVRVGYGVEVLGKRFPKEHSWGRDAFLESVSQFLQSFKQITVAEFEITAIREIASAPLQVRTEIRYTLVGPTTENQIEQRIGTWQVEWLREQAGNWIARKWDAVEESISRASSPMFVDITSQMLGGVASYREQLLRGVDHWRTVLDGASGIDVYGNNGIAVGDFDNDGFDDIYVCQPSGLPNRLYRNRGDGTFEDMTKQAGLDVLDATSSALFADLDNKGAQDLLVVTGSGPLLFVNDGSGKFSLKRDAFRFAHPPQGTFTHVAVADYDRDGRLDVYFCLYNYYAGLDQYRYPSPYFDARNGPPNFLFHNQGNYRFEDCTESSGLQVDNNRFSFACAWGDSSGKAWPDLYVANDFGRNNLYRNNGNGTFTCVSTEAGVEDVGAGMSACWADFDNDGKQDIYVADMWSAAGMRVSSQALFQKDASDDVRELYRQHARGNSLYRNQGSGKFSNVSEKSGAAMGRWAWSSDAWDFDHDGYADLFVANGYISGTRSPDLASFFWRQVVAKSPSTLSPSPDYEHGWNAINELIRSDATWSGFERNVLCINNHDGTFSDVSGVSGLDFIDDARSFALADLDHDGRLEVVLKNRNAPQVRILQSNMSEIGNAIAFRLRGTKSNRDAIGTAITVAANGRAQTKYLQAGTGFLSQHSKELFFGVGSTGDFVRATVRWPNGAIETFNRLPVNHRIEITEGSAEFHALPFARRLPPAEHRSIEQRNSTQAQALTETWLIQPLNAPGFSLPDVTGKTWNLNSLHGQKALAVFWTTASDDSKEQLRLLARMPVQATRPQILALHADNPQDHEAVRAFAVSNSIAFPLLLATDEITGIYNVIFRYLFDRHRDLGIPTSFLIDEKGLIVKVYQGLVPPERVLVDSQDVPRSNADRIRKALPFEGTLHMGAFERNDFTYGVAFFQRGYLDRAADAFRQVISRKPNEPEAYYNLGTLYLRRNQIKEAREHLEQTVRLKPNYPEAWNNLGMIAAEENRVDEAIQNFKQSLSLRPEYTVALLNLGNIYRREKMFAESEDVLERALRIDPSNPETNYALAMLYAQQNLSGRAEQYFLHATELRPNYAEALNNFGVLLVREQRYSDAEAKFQSCIASNPNFDQAYLNLSRLYVIMNDKAKARSTLEALLRQQPEHKMARQALEMLQ